MPNQLIGIRLPPLLLARVDAYTEVLRGRTPGLRVSRQQAIEVLLTRALDADDVTAPPPTPAVENLAPKRSAPAAKKKKKGATPKARKPS